MDQETLKLRRLFAQYLLAPDSRLHVVRAMDGFQAQFLSNAMHAMRLRSADPDAGYAADGLVKSWTLRGTMHLFAEADLPLFLHDGCRYHSRDWTVPSFWNQRPDWALTPQRQAYFSDLIVDTLTQGPMTREALKVRCRAAGMTEAEEASMFHPWGGGIRELCERGFLCGTASEEKAFRLCPPFVPMAREDALQEQLRRYLASFGPVSLRDAAYFFALPQARLRALLMQLPVSADSFDDPLMLGYEKKQSIFLPPEYLRGIFSLSGIVMPPVLLRGTVAGRWKRSGKRLQITAFRPFTPEERRWVKTAAAQLWPEAEVFFPAE